MTTITPLSSNSTLAPPKILVSEPKVTSGLQSPEGRKIAEVTENALQFLTELKQYLEYFKNISEIDYNSVPPKRSERVRMRVKFKGRKKPLPYPLDEE